MVQSYLHSPACLKARVRVKYNKFRLAFAHSYFNLLVHRLFIIYCRIAPVYYVMSEDCILLCVVFSEAVSFSVLTLNYGVEGF